MNLNDIREERKKWLEWKNIKPLREALTILPKKETTFELHDTITIKGNFTIKEQETIEKIAKLLKPWRKGPFQIGSLFIDSEWRSYIKYNLLEKHFNLKDKTVADVGCNNGYYMFRMLTQNPKKLIGFDPSPLFMSQFDFINHFIKSDIKYELLGVEHLEFYEEKFDTIFCLGVLYHRSDPISTLKSLKKALKKDGELFLDTFMIDGKDEVCLTPKERYSKIPNIYFIPTIPALKNWLHRAGFKDTKILEITTTTINEQRSTEWIFGESLNDFLDKNDSTKTVEGYPAPKRVYIKATV